jgi:predicted nucleotidyltransferase
MHVISVLPDELLKPLVSALAPKRVILFGSRARGETHPDSDWDLLVILDDDAPPERLGWRARHEARKGFHRAVDIVACRESAFRVRSRIAGTLQFAADSEGIVVYERE